MSIRLLTAPHLALAGFAAAGLKNADSLRMFDASFASLATLVACRDSAALSLAASLGSMRGFFSVGCRQYGAAVHFGVADTQVHFLGKEANQMHRAQPAGKGVAASPQPAHSRHSSHLDIAVWLRRHMCWQRWQLIGQVERLQRVAAKASAAASEAAGKANSSTIPVLSQAAQQRLGQTRQLREPQKHRAVCAARAQSASPKCNNSNVSTFFIQESKEGLACRCAYEGNSPPPACPASAARGTRQPGLLRTL